MANTQLVHTSGTRIYVTSIEVAQRFNKRHDNVIQAIKNLDCSPEFGLLNFKEISYTDRQNRPQRLYEITRDGFVFLCMGFTGPQAALWKERYIGAFNAMESTLRDPAALVKLEAERDAARALLLAAHPLYRQLTRYAALELANGEIGKLVGKTGSAVKHHLNTLAAAGLIERTPNPRLAAAGRKGQQARQAQRKIGGAA